MESVLLSNPYLPESTVARVLLFVAELLFLGFVPPLVVGLIGGVVARANGLRFVKWWLLTSAGVLIVGVLVWVLPAALGQFIFFVPRMVLLLVPGLIAGYIAKRKGRSLAGWCLLTTGGLAMLAILREHAWFPKQALRFFSLALPAASFGLAGGLVARKCDRSFWKWLVVGAFVSFALSDLESFILSLIALLCLGPAAVFGYGIVRLFVMRKSERFTRWWLLTTALLDITAVTWVATR